MSDPSDTPTSPLGGFALDVDDDLLAAAVAAVEARTRKAPPNPDEMAAFEEDLVVGEDEPLPEEDHGDDGPGEDVDLIADEEGREAAASPSADSDDESLFAEALDRVEELTEALEEQQRDADTLEEQRDDLRGQVATLTAALEQERADKRKAVGLARRWKERAERAEQRLGVSRDASAEAEERALHAENAIKDVEERAQDELRRASARRVKEVEEMRHAAPGKVLKQLLPAIDNLELALRHADQDPSRVIEGLAMIQGQFASALARLGLERVEASPGTPFSPEQHEAFSQEETDAVPPGTVLSEVAAGYRIGDRLLRAARVVVALSPAAPGDEGAPPQDGDSPDKPQEPSGAPPETAAAQPDTTAERPETHPAPDSESADCESVSNGDTSEEARPEEE